MAEESCSHSASAPLRRLLGDKASHLNPRESSVLDRPLVDSSLSFRSTIPDIASRVPWDDFFRPNNLSRFVHPWIDEPSPLQAHQPLPLNNDVRHFERPGWVDDFAAFSLHAHQARLVASPYPQPKHRHHMNENYPDPRLIQFKPIISVYPGQTPYRCDPEEVHPTIDFDEEASLWMDQHGSDTNILDHQGADAEIGSDDNGALDATAFTFESVTQPQPLDPPPVQRDEGDQAEAIAAAARQILVSIHHEAGSKWAQSTFFSLMREFRDGNVRVIGTEIQPSETASFAS